MSADQEKQPDVIYADLGEEFPTEIPSLCMNCHEQGSTRLLLSNIPFWKSVILMSFLCPHCDYRTNEVQQSGIEELGQKVVLKVTDRKDWDRSIVKSESCTLSFPDFEGGFEIPPTTQKGAISTVEGVINMALSSIKQTYGDSEAASELKNTDPESAKKLFAFLERLEKLANREIFDWTLIVDDPAGNSFLENPLAPAEDPNMKTTNYIRTMEQNHALGFFPDEKLMQQQHQNQLEEEEEKEEGEKKEGEGEEKKEGEEEKEGKEEDWGEALRMPENCAECSAPGEVKMCISEIPHFGQVIIMAFNCDNCGHKTNEVKSGGSYQEKGKIITLKCSTKKDLNRYLLKTSTASMSIPELGLDLADGTLGDRFTTVEGLLAEVEEQLRKGAMFSCGDSADMHTKNRMDRLFEDFRLIRAAELEFTLILDDPAGNSHIQSIFEEEVAEGDHKEITLSSTDARIDPALDVKIYDRNEEQDDDLGISDMKI